MLRRVYLVAVLAVPWSAVTSWADVPNATSPGEFENLHQLIKRQPGESRWIEIDWYPSISEARQKAAAERKLIFVIAGSGGATAAGC